MTIGEILSILGLIVTAITFLWNQIRTSKSNQEVENKRLNAEINENKLRIEVLSEHIKVFPVQ